MRIVPIGDFQRVGTADLSGYAATAGYVTIAPGSQVDVCRVGQYVLSVGGVVPFAAHVTPIRGIWGNFDPPGGAVKGQGDLELAIWDKCETPIAGPRAPVIVTAMEDGNKIPTTGPNAGHGAGVDPLLTVPFMGRRECRFQLDVQGGAAAVTGPINWAIRGILFKDRQNFGTGTFFFPGAAEVTGTFTPGTTADQTYNTSLVKYIGGGGDLQEAFEYLHFYIWSPTAVAGLVYAEAEAFGERNR